MKPMFKYEKGEGIKINFSPSIPFIILLYLIGCGLNWWTFSWWHGFIAVLLDLIF